MDIRRSVTLAHSCQLPEFTDNLAFKVGSLVIMESGWYPILDYEVIVQSFCCNPGSLVLGWNCFGKIGVVVSNDKNVPNVALVSV